MNATFIIARLTFREAVRRRIVLTALILGACFLIIYSIGIHLVVNQISQVAPRGYGSIAHNEGINFLLLAGLYTITFLSVAMAALISADTLAGEINSGTIQTVVTKPVRRADVVLGKWLGFAGLLALYILVMAGGVVISVRLHSAKSPARDWADLPGKSGHDVCCTDAFQPFLGIGDGRGSLRAVWPGIYRRLGGTVRLDDAKPDHDIYRHHLQPNLSM
jgi:hypothetical protein